MPLCKVLHNGKTWLVSALGVAACRQYVRTLYVNYRDMLDVLAIARKDAAKHAELVNWLARARSCRECWCKRRSVSGAL